MLKSRSWVHGFLCDLEPGQLPHLNKEGAEPGLAEEEFFEADAEHHDHVSDQHSSHGNVATEGTELATAVGTVAMGTAGDYELDPFATGAACCGTATNNPVETPNPFAMKQAREDRIKIKDT